MSRQRTVFGWAIAFTSLILYLLLSSSREFGAFAPFATPSGVLYATVGIAGFVMGRTCYSPAQAALVLFAVLGCSLFCYGAILVGLPLSLSGMVFFDVLVFWALQRILVYVVFLSLSGAAGTILGIVAREFSPGEPR